MNSSFLMCFQYCLNVYFKMCLLTPYSMLNDCVHGDGLLCKCVEFMLSLKPCVIQNEIVHKYIILKIAMRYTHLDQSSQNLRNNIPKCFSSPNMSLLFFFTV